MNSYYAEAKWRDFIEMASKGLRSLGDPSALAFFYSNIPDVPSEDIAARFKESSDYRLANDLPGVGADAFASQLAASSAQATFVSMASEMGVEVEYTEDMVSEVPDQGIPKPDGIEGTIETLIRKGFEVDAEALAARFPIPPPSDAVLHIEEDPPSTWAEEDPTVTIKRRRAETYVQDYVGGQ